ncbi:hypothetical protein [Streptomyces sp. NPDC005385]|uniref:hypothetical protein n=1 Tax=Streptomyces sp. NPDC005385 TaxID=3157039 RepID=UPI0033B830B3
MSAPRREDRAPAASAANPGRRPAPRSPVHTLGTAPFGFSFATRQADAGDLLERRRFRPRGGAA